ncbi:MAG: hypothetical protein WC346_17170 [Methanogenium sp.]|jgi:hypothetical protein
MVKIVVNKSDLNRVLAAIDRVGQVVASLVQSIPQESAMEFSDELRNAITSQKYSFVAHSEKYLNRFKEGDDQFWYFLGTLLKSIKPWNVLSTPELVEWYVGLKYQGGSGGASTIGGGGTETKKKRTVLGEYKGKTEDYKHGEVRHIDPKDYVPSQKRYGDSRVVSFGHEPVKRKELHTWEG